MLQTENQNGMIGKSSYTVQKRNTQIELQLFNEKQKQNSFSQLKQVFGWVKIEYVRYRNKHLLHVYYILYQFCTFSQY